MDKIIVDYIYDKDEYVKGYRKYLIASKKIRKTDILLVCVLVPLLGAYMVKSGMRPILIAAFGIAVFAAVTGCILYFYTPIKVYNQAEKLKEEYHLEFTSSGIQFGTASIHSNLTWSIYKEAWECEEYFFLIQGGYQFTLIPKRVMTEPQRITFTALLKDKFPSLKKV